jgi:RNA polymerase subunit RPABC4/transcription elongation factor Spt4
MEKRNGDEKAGNIMQLKNEAQTGFDAQIRIIPVWAWTLAGIGFILAQCLTNIVLPHQHNGPPAWARPLLGILLGLVLGCYLLLIGYINRDAKRRGMSPLLWTVVAIIIPNALGIILYFILRQPLRSACPQCGNAIQSGFNFCPACSNRLSLNCPQCQRVVGVNDAYCPYCGTSLRHQAATNPALPTSG